jgi:hypothetical protein
VRVIIVLSLLLTGPLPSGPVQAADDGVCQDFAMTMLAYVKTNALRHCTGMGPAWSPRPAEHLGWCKGATDAAVKNRLAESKAFIEQCLKTGIGGKSGEAPIPAAPAGAQNRAAAAESSLPKPTYP